MVARHIRAHRSGSQQSLSADWEPWHEMPPEVSRQFFGPRVSLTAVDPETALLSAVLEDALVCFQSCLEMKGQSIENSARQAEEWFFSDDSRWLFSFVSICTVLGLEPEVVRRRLKHWRESHTPQGTTQRGPGTTLNAMTTGRRA